MVKKEKPVTKNDKIAVLTDTIALMNAKYKRNVVSFGQEIERSTIPFKVNSVNEITSGGIPEGKFSVIWGSKGSAKTTSAYDLVANAQKKKKRCYWIDLERTFNVAWATKQGVDVKNLLLGEKFVTAEEALDSLIFLTKRNAIDFVVIDSIQGLSPEGEHQSKQGVEKGMSDDTMALVAKKLSQFFRMSSSGVALSNCTVLLIGQTRKDLGGYVTLDKLSGGNALEHWSALTIHLRRGTKADSPAVSSKTGNKVKPNNPDAKIIGFPLIVRVDKSKVGPDEGKICNIKFVYGEGNCEYGDAV